MGSSQIREQAHVSGKAPSLGLLASDWLTMGHTCCVENRLWGTQEGSRNTTWEAVLITQERKRGRPTGKQVQWWVVVRHLVYYEDWPTCFDDGSHVSVCIREKNQFRSTQSFWAEQLEVRNCSLNGTTGGIGLLGRMKIRNPPSDMFSWRQWADSFSREPEVQGRSPGYGRCSCISTI